MCNYDVVGNVVPRVPYFRPPPLVCEHLAGFVVSGNGHLALTGLEIVSARTAFVVQHGARLTVDSATVSDSRGGFAATGRTKMVIRSSIVRRNAGWQPSVVDASGDCEVHITHCVFSDNTASDQGILRVVGGGSLSMHSVQLLDNEVRSLALTGGIPRSYTAVSCSLLSKVQRRGMMWFDASTASMSGLVFARNSAVDGAAFMYSRSSTVVVQDTEVAGTTLPTSKCVQVWLAAWYPQQLTLAHRCTRQDSC